jgi:hypothetical protein
MGYLVLAKLGPVVRDQVLATTTVTANELVTEEKLRFIARERNHVEQRRMYERLLAGKLRCTRAKAWLPITAGKPQHPTEGCTDGAAPGEDEGVGPPCRDAKRRAKLPSQPGRTLERASSAEEW